MLLTGAVWLCFVLFVVCLRNFVLRCDGGCSLIFVVGCVICCDVCDVIVIVLVDVVCGLWVVDCVYQGVS